MFGHFALVLLRSFARHRRYAALNVLGLAAGIAVFLVSMLVVRYEFSFDRWLPDAARTWRLDGTSADPGQPREEYSFSSFVILPLLRADFPRIEAGARVMNREQPVSVGQTIDDETVTYVDPSYLDVVGLPLVAGDRARALATPGSVVISATLAHKYFGTADALGRTLDISRDGVRRSFTVSAVMRDLPPNSTLKVGLLVPFTPAIEAATRAFQSWTSNSGETYLRLASRADAAAVAAGLRDFVRRRASGNGDDEVGADAQDRLILSLVPLTDAHFHDVSVTGPVPGVDRRVVWSLAAVGVMALLTAAINYVNLATARAGARAREVALRKVVGATRWALLRQFLGEAMALVALAALIGLAAAELAVPVVNALGGWAVRLPYAVLVPVLLALVLVVGVGAGAYPAVLLAGYRPAPVLASARAPAGGRMGTRLRNLLVLVQFVSAIAFAICTLVIDAQADLLRNADRGFDRQGLIIVRSLDATELQPRQIAILNLLRQIPGVVSATLSDREPDSNQTSGASVEVPGLPGPAPTLLEEVVGGDYLRTYGIHLISGRWFDARHRQDDLAGRGMGGGTWNVVVNRSALPVLGVHDPRAALGKDFSMNGPNGPAGLRIIGVVQDVRFMSPREKVAGQVYLYNSRAIINGQGAIRFAGVTRAEMLRRLAAAWRGVAPDNPFVASTADQRLAAYYRPDQQRARLFSAGAVLAIAIACVGLYGLASFSTGRRLKEIGIRKVLGASTWDVLRLLVGQFVRPVLIANLIAWPIAFVAMRNWLAGFDQRIALSAWYFLAASGGALLIAVLTVLGQAWRVARAEPARALRYE